MMARMHIGTSGWHYKHWRGCFYPEELKSSEYLSWYIRHFNTVEVNNCFYRLPAESAVENWRDQTPSGFCFAVKGSRFLTHIKRLNDAEEGLENFLSRMGLLKRKFGPVLFQLPPNWHVNAERLQKFLQALPRKHPCVFEFRDPTWYRPEIYDLLRRYRVGLCLHDWGGQPSPVELTADFTYIRFHGATGRYQGEYTPEMLRRWADLICQWRSKLKNIYAYFNNDVGGHAIRNALLLRSWFKEKEELCA